MCRLALCASLIIVLLHLAALSVDAAWPENGAAICSAQNNQDYPQIVSDGSGGAIIAWLDDRDPAAAAIYAQRIDGDGAVLWAADGVLINTPSEFIHPLIMRMVSDGAGGAIIAWIEDAGGVCGVIAQRVNADGELQWWAGGSNIGNAGGMGDYLEMEPDGMGGAVLAWQVAGGMISDVRAQRIAPQGYVMWDASGVIMGTASHDQREPALTGDGAGGAIVSWNELTGTYYNIRAQRIRPNGTIVWAAGGIAVSSVDSPQSASRVAADFNGGAVFAWTDTRLPALNADIYAQRIDSIGTALWSPAGVAVCAAAGDQTAPRIAGESSGGSYIVWIDNRAMNDDIYAQRLRADGAAAWTSGGIAACSETSSEYAPQIAVNADGDALIVWQDLRSDYGDIYLQKYDTAGVAAMPLHGGPVCTATNAQARPQLIPHAPGGAFMTWIDGRDGGQLDIFALAVTDQPTAAEPPAVERAVRLDQNVPNPFNPATSIAFTLAEPGTISLKIFDVEGRLVRELANGQYSAGPHVELWNGRDSSGRAVSSGIYFCRLDAGAVSQTRKMVVAR